MARINVEDSIYRDHRFVKLCSLVGSMEAALGTLVLAWDLAQRAFWKGSTTVPIEQMRTRLNNFQHLVECGLASIIDGSEVYIAGSEEAFKNLENMRAKRREAGLKSAEARKKKGERTKRTQTNKTQHNGTKSNPSTSTSTSTSTSVISFPSENSANALTPTKANPVALWYSLYKHFRGHPPELLEADKGKLANFGKNRSEEKLRTLFSCFFQIKKPYYESRSYSVATFFSDLETINQAVRTGIDPSKPTSIDPSILSD